MRLRRYSSFSLPTAEDLYDGFGDHVPTKCGDVAIQAIPFRQALRGASVARVAREQGITRDEAAALVRRARDVAEWAAELGGCLAEADAAWRRGDADAAAAALEAAAQCDAAGGTDAADAWAAVFES